MQDSTNIGKRYRLSRKNSSSSSITLFLNIFLCLCVKGKSSVSRVKKQRANRRENSTKTSRIKAGFCQQKIEFKGLCTERGWGEGGREEGREGGKGEIPRKIGWGCAARTRGDGFLAVLV